MRFACVQSESPPNMHIDSGKPTLSSTTACRVLMGMPARQSLGEIPESVRSVRYSSHPIQSTDRAAWMFTSGSTGKPRGVMVSQLNIRANPRSIIEYLNLTEKDRVMTVLPFHHCFLTSPLAMIMAATVARGHAR